MTKSRSVGCQLYASLTLKKKKNNLPNKRTFKKVKITGKGEYNTMNKSLDLKQNGNDRLEQKDSRSY